MPARVKAKSRQPLPPLTPQRGKFWLVSVPPLRACITILSASLLGSSTSPSKTTTTRPRPMMPFNLAKIANPASAPSPMICQIVSLVLRQRRASKASRATKAVEAESLLTVALVRINWGLKAANAPALKANQRWPGNSSSAIRTVQTTANRPNKIETIRPMWTARAAPW